MNVYLIEAVSNTAGGGLGHRTTTCSYERVWHDIPLPEFLAGRGQEFFAKLLDIPLGELVEAVRAGRAVDPGRGVRVVVAGSEGDLALAPEVVRRGPPAVL